MDTESVEFLEELPGEIKEYFFKTGTYPLESYFSALPNGKSPRAEPKTDQDQTKEEHARSALIAQWSGKRPAQIARMILCKYFELFSSCTLHKVEQLRKLFFKSRTTWDNIDGKLKAAAYVCHQQHKELHYWDLMRIAAKQFWWKIANLARKNKETARRFTVKKSPNQISRWVVRQNNKIKIDSETSSAEKEYSYNDGKAYVTFFGKKYGLPDERYEIPDDDCTYISKMSACRYCWRAAFKPFGELWAYCHIHQSPKAVTRDHIKNAKTIRPNDDCFMSDIFTTIWQDFMPNNIIKIRKISNGIEEDVSFSLQEIWRRAPHIIIASLPNVLQFLESRGVDTKSTEQVIKELEFPPPDFKETTNKARIRKMYYDDFAQDYATYAPHLIWAEIWLKYETERPKRGGVRKRAGRPRQRPLEIPTKI